MVRILLLIPFLLWMVYSSQPPANDHVNPRLIGAFFGGYVLLIAAMRWWAMRLTRSFDSRGYFGPRRFSFGMVIARFIVANWFAIGLYLLSWGAWVSRHFTWPNVPVTSPGVIVGTLPALAAWVALWWANFPVDRALREQNLLYQLESNLPVHAPPRLRTYLLTQLRLQMLFTVVPVLMILVVRDAVVLTLRASGHVPNTGSDAEDFILLAASIIVFIVAPEIMRRVLHTQRLPNSPLRARLEEMCRRVGLRYRDILLWRTENNLGNAAVMGIIPQFRYILLSDLLIESMTDEQIEAVFAHELGHVIHRHMAWYVVLVMTLMMFVAAMGALIPSQLPAASVPKWLRENLELLLEIGSIIAFFFAFGFVSRRFERQADVYAARTMEKQATVSIEPKQPTHVGAYGASIFNSALRRVAVVNNLPLTTPRRSRGGIRQRVQAGFDGVISAANNWLHGSVTSRMDYLTQLSSDPTHTARFDRRMFRVYVSLMIALMIAAAAIWVLRAKVFAG